MLHENQVLNCSQADLHLGDIGSIETIQTVGPNHTSLKRINFILSHPFFIDISGFLIEPERLDPVFSQALLHEVF